MSLSVCGSGTKIGRLWMRVLEAAGRSNDSRACVCGIEILWRKRWWVLCCRAWRRRRRWTSLFGTGSIICFAFTTFGLAVQNCRRLSLTSPISLQPPASSSMHNITWRRWTNPGFLIIWKGWELAFHSKQEVESSEFSQLQNTLEKDETILSSTTSFFFPPGKKLNFWSLFFLTFDYPEIVCPCRNSSFQKHSSDIPVASCLVI